jgi:CheY-like chemotaxis protein
MQRASLASVKGGSERILLVDDEEVVARMMKLMLERLGYQASMYTSCLDSLRAFKASPDAFDLVISDMTMPNMTGLQLAREIRTVRPGIPIIICTGFSEQINEEKCQALGIQGLVKKPVITSKMASAIRGAFEG